MEKYEFNIIPIHIIEQQWRTYWYNRLYCVRKRKYFNNRSVMTKEEKS